MRSWGRFLRVLLVASVKMEVARRVSSRMEPFILIGVYVVGNMGGHGGISSELYTMLLRPVLTFDTRNVKSAKD